MVPYLPEIPRDRQTALHNDMIDALNSAYSKGLFKEYEYQGFVENMLFDRFSQSFLEA